MDAPKSEDEPKSITSPPELVPARIERGKVGVETIETGELQGTICDCSPAEKKKKSAKAVNAKFEIYTSPGSYPLIIDGQQRGETSPTVQFYDLAPGRHTVEIRFPNNTRWVREFDIAANKKQCITLNYRPKTISIERPVIAKSPCPYPVNISAPASVLEGDIITFTSDAAYDGERALNYTWTVYPPDARIMSGAGTPTITVDTTGLGRQRVTAILVVDDGSGDPVCRRRAQAVTGVMSASAPLAQARRFDEFQSSGFNDDKARLDNFAIELQNDPSAMAYIIAYGGRVSRVDEAKSLGSRAKTYLIGRGIDPSRIVFIDGGYHEVASYQLWIVPQGAGAPTASPTVASSEVRIVGSTAATANGHSQTATTATPNPTPTPTTDPDATPTPLPNATPGSHVLEYALLIKAPKKLEVGEWQEVEVSIIDKADAPLVTAEKRPGLFSRLVSWVKRQFVGGSERVERPSTPFVPPRRPDLPQARLFLLAKLTASGYNVEERNVDYAALDDLPLSWQWRIKADDPAEASESLLVKFMAKWRMANNQETQPEACPKCVQKFAIEVYTPWIKKGMLALICWVGSMVGGSIAASCNPWLNERLKALYRKRLGRFGRIFRKRTDDDNPE